jgi:hypothetical protein
MPVEVVWDDETCTALRQVYSGHLKLDDYMQATDDLVRMATSVAHTVHSIMDRTAVLSTPGVLLPALRYANQHVPPNLGLRVIIKPSMFTRVFVDLGRRVAPRLMKNIYFVDSLDEARKVVAEHGQAVGGK